MLAPPKSGDVAGEKGKNKERIREAPPDPGVSLRREGATLSSTPRNLRESLTAHAGPNTKDANSTAESGSPCGTELDEGLAGTPGSSVLAALHAQGEWRLDSARREPPTAVLEKVPAYGVAAALWSHDGTGGPSEGYRYGQRAGV